MFETKAFLASLANNIARAQSTKEAYTIIVESANVEGVHLPSYEEKLAEIEALRKES